MKKIQHWLRNYFGFSQYEIRGFTVLMTILLFLLVSPWMAKRYWLHTNYTEADYRADLEKLNETIAQLPKNQKDSRHAPAQAQFSAPARKEAREFLPSTGLSAFDPNKADENKLTALGLPPYLARRIVNYRQKGGSFRIKSDLKKIYGFSPQDYQRLYAFIDLPDSLSSGNEQRFKKELFTEKKSFAPSPFEINTADTAQLSRLRGIGPVLSARIVKFRDKLGGFHSLAQLKEVYGLSPEVYEEVVKYSHIGHPVRKINLNTADAEMLRAHPYIGYRVAKTIVAYREQHGLYQQPEDLLKIKIIDQQQFEKLAPYLE